MRCAVFDTLDQQALPTIKSPLLILALIVIHVATAMDMDEMLMGNFGRRANADERKMWIKKMDETGACHATFVKCNSAKK